MLNRNFIRTKITKETWYSREWITRLPRIGWIWSIQIDQSNAQWRRQINTQNTAVANESARINAQNLLGLSTQAQNQLWQRYRDEAAWVLQRAESAAARAHQFAVQAQQNEFSSEQYQTEFKDSVYSELGSTIFDKIFG